MIFEVCSESLLVVVDNFTVYADLDHTRRDIQTAEAFMKGAFPQANFKVDTWGENHKEVREIQCSTFNFCILFKNKLMGAADAVSAVHGPANEPGECLVGGLPLQEVSQRLCRAHNKDRLLGGVGKKHARED